MGLHLLMFKADVPLRGTRVESLARLLCDLCDLCVNSSLILSVHSEVSETLSERCFLKFPCGRAWDRVHELERVRQPELGELRRENRPHVLARRGPAPLGPHARQRALAPLG